MPDFSIQGIKDAIGSLLGQSAGEDAVSMLMDDHKRVREIFDTFKDLDDDEKIEAKHKALVELALHAAVEEKLVYPLLRDEGEEDEVNEAFVEHHVVKLLIVELEAMKEVDAMLDAKFKVLGEIVEHHVKEEESEMFPKLRSSDNDLQELGAEIKSKKEELLALLGNADDLGKIDPELAPRSTQNNRDAEQGRSASNGTNGNGKSKAHARNGRATARKGPVAKKSGAKTMSGSKTAASAKKASAKTLAPQSKTGAKTSAKASLASGAGKKATKKATAKPTARAKATKTKTASGPGKRLTSSASKTTLKSSAKGKKPSTTARQATPAKKTAKKSK